MAIAPPYEPPEWDQLFALAEEAISAADLGAEVEAERNTANLLVALAAAARCRRLMMGVVALIEADLPDVMGVLLRTLFECWLAGTFALVGGQKALVRLIAERNYQENQLARVLGEPLDDALESSKPNVADLAARVTTLLEERGNANAGFARAGYETIYRYESHMSIHGGLGSVSGHTFEDETLRRILPARPEQDAFVRHKFVIAVSLLVSAAQMVAIEASLPHSALDSLGDQILDLDPRRNRDGSANE